jgi:hypothetical protein
MAKYWIDQNSYPVYAAVPATLGTNGAQDGDGLASTTARSAVASLDISAVATAGSTITVMGVVLTAVASGANTTQFNVGATLAIQATNIATALNAATGQVSISVSLSRHQIKNMVYAWASGTTVNIMTRAGSALFNHAANANVAISVTGALTATIVQFTSGVSGAWGYLASNNTTIWPSAIARNQYGVLYSGIGFAPLAYSAAITAADTVMIRANNNVLELSTAGNTSLAISTSGTFIVDDGTEWPGDTGSFEISGAAPTGVSTYIYAVANTDFTLTSKVQERFVVEASGAHLIRLASGPGGAVSGYVSFSLDNVTLNDVGATSQITVFIKNAPMYNGARVSVTRLNHKVTANKWYTPIDGLTSGGYNNSRYLVGACKFDFSTYTGTPATPLIGDVSFLGAAVSNAQMIIRDIEVVCTNKPLVCASTIAVGATHAAGCELIIDNITGGLPYATLGLFGSFTGTFGSNESAKVLQSGVGNTEQYKMETTNSLVYWNPSANQPTLDSQLFSGDYWSLGVGWLGTTLGYIYRRAGIPVHQFNTAIVVPNVTSVRMELLIDGAIVANVTNKHIVMLISYVNSAGVPKVRSSSYVADTPVTLPSSSATWNKQGYTGYVARKVEVSLPDGVLLNTQINVTLVLTAPAPQAGQTEFFINPDLGLTSASNSN